MRLVPQPHVHRPRELPQPAPVVPPVVPPEVPTVVLVRVLHVGDRPERKKSPSLQPSLGVQGGRGGCRIDAAQAGRSGCSSPRSVGWVPSARLVSLLLQDTAATAGSRVEGGERCRGSGIENGHNNAAGRLMIAAGRLFSRSLVGSRFWELRRARYRGERTSCGLPGVACEGSGVCIGRWWIVAGLRGRSWLW